jgi:predicted ATP-dependent protease
MTGEITLSGLVLPVGGIREKSLAARRHAIKTFVLPQANSTDIAELPEEVRRDMTFVPATTIEDVLRVALPDVLPLAAAGPGLAAAGAGSPPATAVAATDIAQGPPRIATEK